jgi:mannose-6-phosphate isomerase-like protein (cupin superfamily)
VPDGSWGCLRILEGSAGFTMETDPPLDVQLEAGACQAIPPGVRHAVRVEGHVRLALDFLTPDERPPPDQ